ncbi:MAG: hypothetical protein A2689_02900 [Candidatus Levybacteria bacterium RIFCSPHIGHO2_01_FULL_38_96]|nr:MAG: hypothetical protein A2689_02900 [Candidatus Levybacteria bacterium RIFCSPHIGHO2_01_FULL_38_96]
MPEASDNLRGGSPSNRSVLGETTPRAQMGNYSAGDVEKAQVRRIVGELEAEKASGTQSHKKEQELIVENTRLSSQKRIEKAAEILGRKLSDKEQSAILAAHNVGAEEEGKEGGRAEVFNYTQKQIAQKAQLLKDAGFSPKERRILIESGIAGLPPERFAAIDPDAYASLYVKDIAFSVKNIGMDGNADSSFLQDQISRLDARINSNIDVPEASALLNQLQGLLREAIQQERQQRQGQERRQEQRQEERLRGRYADLVLTPEEFEVLAPDQKENLRTKIIQALENERDPAASRLPENLLAAALQFSETREMILSRILFRSLEADSGRYEINFFASENIGIIMGHLRGEAEMGETPKEKEEARQRYSHFRQLQEAARLFHEMNVAVTSGQIKDFVGFSQTINYKDFRETNAIAGVPQAMRLYEEKYAEIMAKHEGITTEAYEELTREVERSFRNLNEGGLIRSRYTDKRGGDNPWLMKDWEIQTALNVGKAFFNLTMRAAEHIAHSRLEPGGKVYAGFPQEDAARVLSIERWVARRFKIASKRGAQRFLDVAEERFFEFAQDKRRKLGRNRIAEIGGMLVRNIEVDGMLDTRGMYSSWRIELALFENVPFKINGKSTNLKEFLDEEDPHTKRSYRIEKIREAAEALRKKDSIDLKKMDEYEKQLLGKKMGEYQELLLAELAPFIDNSRMALGVLLKQGMLSGEVAYKARQRIWERVAQVNLPLMINYLSKINIRDQIINLTEKDAKNKPTDWTGGVKAENKIRGDMDDDQWVNFKDRVLRHHTEDMQRASRGEVVNDNDHQGDYSPEEWALIGKIRNLGSDIAPDLADIMFSYVPFMNDVPFEELDYARPGDTMYKRAIGGDVPNFFEASNNLLAICNNVGGEKIETILEAMLKIERGIESPQGNDPATERLFPIVSAWGDLVMTKGGKRQIFVKALADVLRVPTSEAQTFIGKEALSLSEPEMLKALGEAEKHGIITHEQYNEMKKKKHLTLFWLLWLILRDVVVMAPLIAGWQVGKQTGGTLKLSA